MSDQETFGDATPDDAADEFGDATDDDAVDAEDVTTVDLVVEGVGVIVNPPEPD